MIACSRFSGLPGPCLHDFVVCSRSALGASANTNTKLLIYDLFQKGRGLYNRLGRAGRHHADDLLVPCSRNN